MKPRQFATHGGWAVAAAAAFVVGSTRSGSLGEADPGAAADERTANSFAGTSGSDTDIPDRLRPRSSGESDSPSDLARIFGTTLGLGIDALAEMALKDPNPINRRLAFARLLESLTPENAVEMRAQLAELGMDDEEWRDFHYAWGAMSGLEAFEFAMASEEQDLAITMSGWAAANPQEAIAMLANLPESLAGQKAELQESLVAGVADHDLDMATSLAIRLAAEGAERPDSLIRTVANEALRTGSPSSAAAWAASLPDGQMKGAAMDHVAGAYVRQDPEQAAGWISQYSGEDFAQRAIAEVGGEWGERAPEDALGWLQTLPDGIGQKEGFRSVFGDWEDTNPTAASEYLVAMPPSPQRDAAVSGFARGYAWQDPQTALAWAQDISDPELRQRSLTQVGQAYFRRDPERALTWLESSELPESARKAVISPRRWR